MMAVGLAAAAPARADDAAAARARFEVGVRAFAAKDYAAAIRAFTESHRLYPTPSSSFNLAQSYERSGDLKQAALMYRRYLREAPLAADRVQVRQHLAELERRTGPLPSEPGEAGGPLPPAGSSATRLEATPGGGAGAPGRVGEGAAPPPRRLRWTWVAAGATVALVGAATTMSTLFVLRRDSMRSGCGSTPTGCSPGDVSGLEDRGLAANVLWGVSAAAAIATGVTLWLELRRPGRRVTVAPHPGGLALLGRL